MKRPPTDLSQYFSQMGRKGGQARKKALSSERRSEIAKKANAAAAAKRTAK